MGEKCNREMIWCNARDEQKLSRRSRSGLVVQNELGKAATTWNQLLLLILRYLIPKVVEPPPDIHHAGVEAVDGPRFNQNQRRIRSGEKWRVFVQLQISATYVFLELASERCRPPEPVESRPMRLSSDASENH